MERKHISREALRTWLDRLSREGRRIYAPVAKGKTTDFACIQTVDEISMEHIQTAQSAKAAVFPRAEKLFSYTKGKGDVSLHDYDPSLLPETVVFGTHPCDAAALKPLSAIFNWDTADKPFNERRKRMTVVSLSCSRSDEYCFCTSVNGGPGHTEGSDILLTAIPEGYLAEIVTEQGKHLADTYGKDLFGQAADINKEDHLATVLPKFSLEELRRKLSGMFESEVWKDQSERCIGCGACAFVCPACACFDIQEETKGNSGRRIRCWDSCGFSLFTAHTSGHNPREVQGQRWRQRLLHKFSYMPERLAVEGCTGCGRCSRACPVDMNLSEHLTEIAEL